MRRHLIFQSYKSLKIVPFNKLKLSRLVRLSEERVCVRLRPALHQLKVALPFGISVKEKMIVRVKRCDNGTPMQKRHVFTQISKAMVGCTGNRQ